tara:strand:+ start:4671 stop:4898 length:228 start_codon:yes stop_codon:yes gene_type:complete
MNGKIINIIDSKTAKVECVEYKKHPLYGKYTSIKKKFVVDSSNISINIGDNVIIKPCRPLSKLKRWSIEKKVQIK